MTTEPTPGTRPSELDRRRFLAATAGLTAAALAVPVALAQSGKPSGTGAAKESGKGAAPAAEPDGPFVLDPLPYAPEALEPFIDAETMRIHHGKHHAAYVKNLNAAVKGVSPTPVLATMLADLAGVPSERRTAVRNHGGGHYNHTLFWGVLAPKGMGGEPSKELVAAIESDLGGMAKFQEAISAKAMSQFGSGWAWLIVNGDRKLAVTATPNQDNPLMRGVVETLGTPIFGIDVWEHAYYLKYQNRRADYLKGVLELVNWAKVSEAHAVAMAGA